MMWYESERFLEFGNLQPGDYIVPGILDNSYFTDNELIKINYLKVKMIYKLMEWNDSVF